MPGRATLYIFGGLPGAGKSTLAQRLAQRLGAAWIRIDTIEQSLRDLCGVEVQGEGYELAYRLAADNLRLGLGVVADSCNPIEQTRDRWDAIARNAAARAVNIEIICSDPAEHRQRVENRVSSVPGLRLPTWQQVCEREYHPWSRTHLVIDTAGRSVEEAFALLLARL